MRCTTYSASLITCLGLCATHVMWTPLARTSTMWEVWTGLKALYTIMLAVLPIHTPMQPPPTIAGSIHLCQNLAPLLLLYRKSTRSGPSTTMTNTIFHNQLPALRMCMSLVIWYMQFTCTFVSRRDSIVRMEMIQCGQPTIQWCQNIFHSSRYEWTLTIDSCRNACKNCRKHLFFNCQIETKIASVKNGCKISQYKSNLKQILCVSSLLYAEGWKNCHGEGKRPKGPLHTTIQY